MIRMLEIIKRNYVNICIALVYTTLACLVYGIWSYHAWHLWYVSFIIVLLLTALGIVVGFFWIKSENKKKEVQSKEEMFTK